MKIFVNGLEVKVFAGALVRDVLRSYSPEEFQHVNQGVKEVTDRFGHSIDLDGELSEGDEIRTRDILTPIREK